MVPVYTPLCAQERQLEQWGGLFSLILPHSPDLPTSDFHLFLPLKDALLGCCFVEDDDLQHGMCEELGCFSRQFYVASIQHLIQWSKMCVDDEDNNLHTVEDVHMKYVNLIRIEIIASKKKWHYLCTASCTLSKSTRTLSR